MKSTFSLKPKTKQSQYQPKSPRLSFFQVKKGELLITPKIEKERKESRG
jgi:hypothetical protein